jgi:hypothetical protein
LNVENGRLLVYYGGTEGPHRQIFDSRAPSRKVGYQEDVIDHGAHFLPFNAALCRASWRFDRLYALTASAGGPTLGIAVTRYRPIGGKTLLLDLRTRPAKKAGQPGLDEGMVQIELLDSAGKGLPGFRREDCHSLKGDHAALDVRWKGGEVTPAGTRQAAFYLKRAFLYGFEFRDARSPGAARFRNFKAVNRVQP